MKKKVGRYIIKYWTKAYNMSYTMRHQIAFIFVLCFSVSLGNDTIFGTQSISGDDTIVSSGGNFELGFFKPGKSSNYYIGIWYKKILTTPKSIVWVANRETPVSNNFLAELKLIDSNLVLLNESKVPIWSTDVSSATTSSNCVIAVLLDDGNLVLRDGSKPESLNVPVWQSFDFQTNTFLPGSKFGYNKRANRSQRISSWKNLEDPAEGLFSVELDPIERQFIILRNRSQKYWASGPWNDQVFSLVPEMRLNHFFNFSYVDNENETYLMYTLSIPSLTSRLVLDVSGQIKQETYIESSKQWNVFWAQPRQPCQIGSLCGSFGICNQNSVSTCNCLAGFKPKSSNDWNLSDYSGGCVRKIGLECRNEEKLGFVTSYIYNSYDSLNSLLNSTSSARDEAKCESDCLKDCTCDAYAFGMDRCWIWNGEMMDLHLEGDSTMIKVYIKVAASDLHSPISNTKKLVTDILFACTGLVFLVLCGTCFIYYKRRFAKQEREAQIPRSSEFQVCDSAKKANYLMDPEKFNEDNPKGFDVPFIEFNTILAATDNFSEENKLGQGGFGPVYMGKLTEGVEIAVKRLSSRSGQGLKEFKNEVQLIAKLQHRNLVNLLGYSIQEHEMILVYEYMPNKSLDRFIFDRMSCMLLDWSKRFEIILGIARGLLYLHQDSRLRIIHRDLKTSNILLDKDMNPKISDFGLARIVNCGESESSTKIVCGTYGYMSPEYALDGLFSVKSDVFSFGVVVLEIISGKRNTSFYHANQTLTLLGHAWNLWKEEKPLELIDLVLIDSCNTLEVLKCIIVGLLCVQDDPGDRPTMTDALMMLGGDVYSLPNPKKPAFVARKRVFGMQSTSNKSEIYSWNELTSTLQIGR